MKKQLLSLLALVAAAWPSAAQFSVHLTTVATEPVNPTSGAHSIELANNRAYMALKNSGVAIYDVSNPESPRHLGTARPTGVVVNHVTPVGDHVFCSRGSAGLDVWNVANPTSATWVTTVPLSAAKSFAANGYLYVAGGNGGLRILNVQNPAAPVVVTTYLDLPSPTFWDLKVKGDRAYITGGNDGLYLVNVANPAGPFLLGRWNTSYSAQPVFPWGRHVFVGGDSPRSFEVIDVSNPAAPVPAATSYGIWGQPVSIQVADGLAFVGEHDWYGGQGRIVVFDVGNPAQPREVGQAYADNYLRDMKLAGKYLFVAQSGNGLKIFRIDCTGLASPQFTKAPQNTSVTAGQSATLSVVATGAPNAMIRWQRSVNGGVSWSNIPEGSGFSGTDLPNLTVSPAPIEMNGNRFRAMAFSVAGTNFSDGATLLVDGSPLITGHPQSLRVGYGQNASFGVTNLGAPAFSYQWMCNGYALAGQTKSSMTLSNVTIAAEGSYAVRVSNGFGSVTSGDATLQVNNVVAWGYNSVGQTSVPLRLSRAAALQAGGNHSLALNADGSVLAWGYNNGGQTNVPTGLGPVIALAGGQKFSLALRPDGTVAAWGTNNSLPAASVVPIGLDNVVAISAAGDWAMALRSDGRVITWGAATFGVTRPPADLTNITAIAAGYSFGMALRANGTVVAWGDSSTFQTNVPPGLSNVVAIAAGWQHALALRSDGTVVGWGWNIYGQAAVPWGLSNVVGIAAGGAHSVALRSDGTVRAWGYNQEGQTSAPAGLTNVVMISCGDNHTLALQGNPAEVINHLRIDRHSAGMRLSFPTVEGQFYVLEYADSLGAAKWRSLVVVRGYGLGVHRSVVDPGHTAAGAARFYRTKTAR